jgi:hypothetical protein
METFKERLKRFTDGDAADTFGWMTLLLQNHNVPELRCARENKLYLCVYLMSHALIQTVSESMFGKTGLEGTRFFLRTFVDAGGTPFSPIASEIHDVRNVIAHQAYSGLQHRIEYFADEIDAGWQKADGVLFVNPARYSLQVEAVFRTATIFRAFQQTPQKQQLVRKYQFIRKWLALGRNDLISQKISTLESARTSNLGNAGERHTE